ncbi:hypothetical protein BH11PSE2_BH11PSE2_05610 [soil metagenome]
MSADPAPLEEPSAVSAGTPRLKKAGFWFTDFTFRGGRVKVHDTGADLTLDWTLISESLIWFGSHMIFRGRSWWLRLARRNPPKIWFTPDKPRPWYVVWMAMAWSGVRFANTLEEADAAFYFLDQTYGEAINPPLPRSFNFACPDVSKTRVAEVFETVFGYPLAIDPTAWEGLAVEKGELNGVHDGRVINCPAIPQPGKVYQRLIDTSDESHAYDLRTHCVGGEPVLVWIKTKPRGDSFTIHNLGVVLRTPASVFSAPELAMIRRFAAEFGSDWAGLDILRDRHDGRLYIVDVNKTDVGPIIALSLGDKLRSASILGAALNRLVCAPAAAHPRA